MATGIFDSLTITQLLEMRDATVLFAKGEQISSTSYPGISVSFAAMDLAKLSEEIAYSLNKKLAVAQGNLPANRVMLKSKKRN